MNRRFLVSLTILTCTYACSTGKPPSDSTTQLAPEPDLPFAYAGGDASYSHTSTRKIDQEISGQTMSSQISLHVFLTASISGVERTRTITFTIDSIPEMEGAGYTSADRQKFIARSIRGTFKSTGEISDIDIDSETSPLQSRLSLLIKRFFPVIPEGGVTPGSRWVDTATVDADDGSTRISTTAVTTSLAGQWLEDGTGLPISWETQYHFTGEGQQLGQRFTLEGTGRRAGEHLFSMDGVYLSTASTDSSEATVQLTSMGITVPVRQVGVDTVRVIR